MTINIALKADHHCLYLKSKDKVNLMTITILQLKQITIFLLKVKRPVNLMTITIAVTDFKVDAVNWPGTSEEVFSSPSEENCPTRTSGFHPCPVFVPHRRPYSHVVFILVFIFNFSSARPVCRLRPPPRHLHLHHVLLLHEKGGDQHPVLDPYFSNSRPGDFAKPKGARLPRVDHLPWMKIPATKKHLIPIDPYPPTYPPT